MTQLTMTELYKPKTQKERILDKLERAGDKGVSNIDLNQICFRYSARLKDLRDEGYQISTIRVKDSIFTFILHKEDK